MSTRSSNPELLPGLSNVRHRHEETNQDLIDWSKGEEKQERKTLEERVKRLRIKKIQALPQASNSQGNTRKPHSKAPEIEIVLDNPSREADIQKLVKVHMQNYQDFKLLLVQNQMEEAKTAIKKAMDSQKTLHKLKVSNKEIEGYVDGWSPWDQINETFPANPKNKAKKGKGRSRNSQKVKFNNPNNLQKLSNLNSSFLHEILNKMELLNENKVTSDKNFYNVLQQIYKACSQYDTDAKNSSNLENTLEKFSTHVEKIDMAMIEAANRNTQSTQTLREELSRLNEYISIMNNSLNEATHKNACNLLRVESSLKEEIMMIINKPQPKEDLSLLIGNLTEQMGQIQIDLAQIKRSTSIKPLDTISKESLVKEEEPNLNQTLKILPPITDWPNFYGEGEYDHISFIKYIDHMISAYQIPGRIATMRLPRLFEGVALDWFVTKSELDNPHDWEAWKILIKNQFGTRLWKKKMIKAFESDFFDPMKDKPHKWCLQQKKRLECAHPRSLEHDIKCRIDMDQDLPHLIAVMEEVIEMKGLNKMFLKDTNSIKRPIESIDIKTEEPTPIKRIPIPECYNCGEKGHKKPDCFNFKKKINNMDLLAESEVEDTGSWFDLIISDPMEERETHAVVVIQADIGNEVNINTIQGEAHLPQKWDSSMKIGHVVAQERNLEVVNKSLWVVDWRDRDTSNSKLKTLKSILATIIIRFLKKINATEKGNQVTFEGEKKGNNLTTDTIAPHLNIGARAIGAHGDDHGHSGSASVWSL
ncbi:hypothetical protein BY996DRAFT_6464514 [Phakopsora pachyrhizi]|nr:hypothetical protein BY996DRAFT_6464514 [Phakopsora pachyrhizi]